MWCCLWRWWWFGVVESPGGLLVDFEDYGDRKGGQPSGAGAFPKACVLSVAIPRRVDDMLCQLHCAGPIHLALQA